MFEADADLDDRTSHLARLLKVLLQEHVASERFSSATELRGQIVKLHSDLLSKHKSALISKQKSDTFNLKNYHALQINERKLHWDNKLSLRKEDSELALKKMAVEHRQRLKLERCRLEKAFDRSPKPTSELLNLRRSLESAKRQQRYQEARQLMDKKTELEENSRLQWAQHYEEMIASKLQHIQQQLDRDLDVYKAKLEAGLQELVIRMHKDLAYYHRRYLNSLADANSSQQLELSRN